MSVETPKNVAETAPIESKPAEQPTTTTTKPALASETPAIIDAPKTDAAETPVDAPITATPAVVDETKPVEETLKKDETVVEATPASEGTLGYKAPGFLK